MPGTLKKALWFSALLWILVVPPGIQYGNILLLILLSGVGFFILTAAFFLTFRTIKLWRYPGTHPFSKICATLAVLASLGLTSSAIRWIPFAWRGSDIVIDKVAGDCRKAGIFMQSTLVIYETGLAMRKGFRYPDQLKDPAFPYLPAQLQEQWKGVKELMPGLGKKLWRRHPEFNRTLASALHKAGVPIMAGTDALGLPFVIPGTSLHKELRLLEESGLTPYEVLQAATTIPSKFLGKENEFGTIAPGKRADLLLVEGNPLEDLAFLAKPLGVMVRGIWLPRTKLDEMLDSLR